MSQQVKESTRADLPVCAAQRSKEAPTAGKLPGTGIPPMARSDSFSDNILARVAALSTMRIVELKIQWRALFNAEPPTSSRRYLESRLAYRLQELAYGGLSELTLKRLRALGGALEEQRPAKTRKLGAGDMPLEGTRLVREWRGIEYTVTVRREGFEFQGRPYKTLSPIARAITGTRWSGLVFFGLKRSAR